MESPENKAIGTKMACVDLPKDATQHFSFYQNKKKKKKYSAFFSSRHYGDEKLNRGFALVTVKIGQCNTEVKSLTFAEYSDSLSNFPLPLSFYVFPAKINGSAQEGYTFNVLL